MRLSDLGFEPKRWDDVVARARARRRGVVVGRVAADFGVEHRVIGDFGDERATLTGKLRFGDTARPAVGDFVLLTGRKGSRTVIAVLPRKSWLARQAAGKKTAAQIIAANLDVVFVVTSFNEDFNFNRLERYLTAVRDGGAQGVVVVNKADLVPADEHEAALKKLTSRLKGVPVVSTSALDLTDLEPLEPYLRPQQTASFVGSSGVGKSTIVNRLLGEQRQVTAEVRETDAKGRHTTTHREMFVLDGGAIVIDTPGMREFQLWDDGAGLEVFEDIEAFAAQCHFRDCAHHAEPGCAVLAAVDDGELSEERLESWRKLQAEARASLQRRG